MGRTKVLGVKKICEVCGEEFEPYLNSTQKFCSHKCYGKSLRGPRVKKNCEVCGVEFEVALNSTQRFCNLECNHKSDKRRQAARNTMTRLQQDPEFAAKSRARGSEGLIKYNQSEKGRKTSSMMGREKMAKLNQDPEFIEKRNKVATERINRLNQDPDFIAKRNKATSESMLRRLEDPEYIEMNRERSRKTMTRMNQDPDFCRKRNEAGRKNILNQFKNGDFKFGLAQKILYEELLEFGLEPSKCFNLEKPILLTGEIVDKYPGSNKCLYRIDIAYITDDQIKLAIEVDGSMGHSTDEELQRDKVRDTILLNEFGIKTIRVKNDRIFKSVNTVAQTIIKEINKLSNQTNNVL